MTCRDTIYRPLRASHGRAASRSPAVYLHAAIALLPGGWAENVLLDIDAAGFLAAVTPECADPPADAERIDGPLIPGMPNLHSHAFQRAMAGLTEARGRDGDSFWTWRTQMYAFVERIDPEQARDIAAQAYVEMLRAGYTTVGEFHYLHHRPDGSPYASPSEMSDAIIDAARETGLAITHLPVLYTSNGFGGAAPAEGQRRFVHDGDAFARLVETLVERYREEPLVRIGIAPHSLRAVTREQLRDACDAIARLDFAAPIHIHIAEQTREVEECIAWCGRRPVDWLLDAIDVDRRWCLVHATHVDERECRRLAESESVVGLCPTTEANLGDGLFPVENFLAAGGALGIGSDSNVSLSVIEELRLLEYGQRLAHRRRAILAGNASPSVGRTLYDLSTAGGAQALAQPVGALETGLRADLVVLDGSSPALAAKTGDALLDAWVFAGDRATVKDVMVAGSWRIRDGRHAREDAVFDRYRSALAGLLA